MMPESGRAAITSSHASRAGSVVGGRTPLRDSASITVSRGIGPVRSTCALRRISTSLSRVGGSSGFRGAGFGVGFGFGGTGAGFDFGAGVAGVGFGAGAGVCVGFDATGCFGFGGTEAETGFCVGAVEVDFGVDTGFGAAVWPPACCVACAVVPVVSWVARPVGVVFLTTRSGCCFGLIRSTSSLRAFRQVDAPVLRPKVPIGIPASRNCYL